MWTCCNWKAAYSVWHSMRVAECVWVSSLAMWQRCKTNYLSSVMKHAPGCSSWLTSRVWTLTPPGRACHRAYTGGVCTGCAQAVLRVLRIGLTPVRKGCGLPVRADWLIEVGGNNSMSTGNNPMTVDDLQRPTAELDNEKEHTENKKGYSSLVASSCLQWHV